MRRGSAGRSQLVFWDVLVSKWRFFLEEPVGVYGRTDSGLRSLRMDWLEVRGVRQLGSQFARRLVTVVGAAAVAVSLTACDPPGAFSQPSLMRVVDGDVELMVCDTYEPATIEGFVKSVDGARIYFWEASIGRSLEPGDVVSTDTLDDIFEDVVTASVPAPALGENVAVPG